MIAKYTPSAITLLPGDTFVEIAGSIPTVDGWRSPIKGFQQKRGSAVVATFMLSSMTRSALVSSTFINSSVPFAFYVEEFKMEAVAQTMTGVSLSGSNYNFDFAGTGTPRSLEQLQAELEELQTADMAQKIQRVMAYVRSSGGADMTSQVGKACTIDFNASNPVSFSE